MQQFKQLILNISLSFATVTVASSMASGSTIFNNITTPGAQNGFYVTGNNTQEFAGSDSLAEAVAFTPNGNYLMTSAAAALEFNSTSPSDTNTFNLSLYSDAAGLPGVLLYQIGTNLQAPLLSSTAAPVQATLSTPFALSANTQYWLVVSPAASNSAVFWDGGGSQSTAGAFSRPSLSTWQPGVTKTLQFAINGNAVTATPEPSTLLCLGSGLFLVGAGRGFYRRKV